LTIERSRRFVHFVGSVPLASTAEVLKAIGPMFGELAPRIPDGETGARSLWIQFQRSAMERAENLIQRREYVLSPNITQPVYGLLDPTAPVVFGALGYAENAIDSYREFSSLRRSGQIHESTRFQVSLPTPLAVTAGFIERNSQRRCFSPSFRYRHRVWVRAPRSKDDRGPLDTAKTPRSRERRAIDSGHSRKRRGVPA
jgi:hypothetical protein